jgi:abortive infection protein abiGII
MALRKTAKKRGTYDRIKEFDQVIEIIEFSDIMQQRWRNYSKNFSYAEDIRFEEICAEIKNILKQLNI